MATSVVAGSVCARIAQRVADAVGPRRYSMWFDRTARFDYRDADRRLAVAVPNRFVADWIGRHFEGDLRRAAADELGGEIELRVEVQPELFGEAAPAAGEEAPAGLPGGSSATAAASGAPRLAGTPTAFVAAAPFPTSSLARPERPVPAARGFDGSPAVLRHALEDFIVGPSNELAFAAAGRLVEEDRGASAPLFIHGGCGLGKTHLLQGICRRVLERSPGAGAKVLYTTGEGFTNEFLAAVRSNKIDAFRRKIRSLDLLAVDDVHFIANKQATQQEFLHSFDAIELGGAKVVLASDSHPKLIRQFSEALVSRCVRGMVVEVRPPDAATRGKMVRALAARRGVPLLETAADALAARCIGSVREIEGTLAKLHALASLSQNRRAVGIGGSLATGGASGEAAAELSPLAESVSARAGLCEPIGHTLIAQLFENDPLRLPKRAVRFESIVEAVGGQVGATRPQIMGNGRQAYVVLARSLVIYLARQLTPMSYPEIAAAMERNTHSTIITATQRMERQVAENPPVLLPGSGEEVRLAELVERLKHAIARA